jgi:ABC-type multidrug transport system fused ATPase/permease subunit
VSVARIVELLDADNGPIASADRSGEPDSAADAIVLDGVTFAYPHKAPVLRGATLRIRSGERVALFGASGAGKSTIVQLVFGLRAPVRGSVVVAGRPATVRGACARRDVLGYAGAEPFLLHASVEENVRYGNREATRAAIERALELADAASFVHALPDGVRTIVGGRGLALSDGQRQRLGLARLFARDASILVLDEAFCALDAQTEARIRERLWAAFADRSVLFISHRTTALHEFDRLLVVRDGRIELASASDLAAETQPACA